MSESRDRILARVRNAIRASGPRPAAPSDAPVFEPVTDPERRFREEYLALKGEIIESKAALREFVTAFAKIATDDSAIVRGAVGAGNAPVREADLGVTACDCLVAQMGAIFVTPLSAGGRVLSVLPPVHLVLARREQLVTDLAAALSFVRRRYNGRWPSALSMIAGPSRTGDIEKILVMGAHGPKRLVLYWADEQV